MKDKISEILLNVKAVALKTEPPFKWASGILSPIYTDNRILMSCPKERAIIINSFLEKIKKEKLDFYGFAGTATAGIPWAAWIAQKLKRPMVYVRSSEKDHGKGNLIEGIAEKGKKYVVVEDLISTGGSSINTINAIRQSGGVVEHCISIFTYELEKSKNNFKEANVKLLALTNFTNLVNLAKEKNYITTEQLDSIMAWKKEPESWGRS